MHPIRYKGQVYRSSEHAYQAAKFLGVRDDIANIIRLTESPSKAKKAARDHAEYMRIDWNSVKTAIMYEILSIKFNDPELSRRLLEVNEPIVEDNHWNDTFWGVCNGEGKNNLGKILERIKREKQVFDN